MALCLLIANPGLFWRHSEEQKAAMALRTFLANRVCGRGEVFDNLLTWRLQVATSLKQVVNLMIYCVCRRALFN